MAGNNLTVSCRLLAILLYACCVCFTPSVHSQNLPVDNVLITRLAGLPLVEQRSKELTVGVAVGTTNVPPDANGLEVSYPGPFRLNYTIASGTNSSNAMTLLDVMSLTTGNALSPGTLYEHVASGLMVSLTNYGCDTASLLCVEIISEQPSQVILTGSTKGCIQITCRGVVITFVDPAELESTTLKQGVASNNVRLTVSFDSDPNYASVSGTDLWDPMVFGNGNQFGMTTPMVPATPVLTAVSNYGINSMATSVWPELGVMIDLTDYGCPEARYICVNPRRNPSSSATFTLSFIPDSAQYGCVELDCDGVEFIMGSVDVPTSQFAEYRSNHQLTFTATFHTDGAKGGVMGKNLWRVKAFASMTNETNTPTPISEAYATITDTERDQQFAPGGTLSIVDGEVTLDLSSVSCSSLIYLCIMAERNPNSQRVDDSPLNFDVNSFVVCQQMQCTGLVINTLELEMNPLSDGPLLEFVSGGQDLYVDLVLTPQMNTGGVVGDNLWMFDAFFSDVQDCTNRLTVNSDPTIIPVPVHTGQDVDGLPVTFPGLLVNVSLSTSACSDIPYLCVNLSLTPSARMMFKDIGGVTIASLRYDCKGIELTAATVALTSPSEITERESTTLTVDLTVTANDNNGSAIGDNLWTAALFFSTDMSGTTRELQTDANSGNWQNTNVISGQTAMLTGITATIDLDSTCETMRYLCVQLSKNFSASFTFDVSNQVRVACLLITCHGVEIAETNVAIANSPPITVIENTATSITAELAVTGRASPDSASISGSSLWNLNVFTSSDGMTKDGGIDRIHPLTLHQEATAISTGASFSFVTLDYIDVNFNMVGRPCDENSYLCAEILVGDSPMPPFTLTMSNTTGCASLNCRGIILTNTNNTVNNIPNGGVLVEGFPNQDVDLRVDLTTDSMGAQAVGTGLWQLDVFTNAFENGTGPVKRFDTTLTSGSWIDTNVPAGSTTPLVVSVMVDLSNQICMDVNYLCVRIREGIMPSPNITLQYSTGPENFVGCAPVNCETAGIERNNMSFTPQRIVEHQVAPEPFTVSVSYISEPSRDNITGNNLWNLTVFFSDSENGTNPSAETQVDLGPLANAPFYSGQTLDFNNVAVNISLRDLTCYMNTYFCTQLEKGNPNNNNYTLEVRPDCRPIECAGIALNSTRVSVMSGQLLFEYQSSQSSSLDVTLNSLPEGASIGGSDLWNFTVFLSNSDTMSNDRVAVLSTSTYTSSGSPLVAGTPFTISGVQSQLDLEDIGCIHFRYICVQVAVGSMAMPSFNLDLQVPNADIGCAPVDCRGVLITGSDFNLIDGDLLIERVPDHEVTFNVSLQFSDESTNIYGQDLWQASIFTNSRSDGSDPSCSSSQPVLLNGNVTRGQMVSLETSTARLNISECSCSQMQFLCLRISMNPGASVNFTLESPVQGFLTCLEVSCTGVVIDGVDLILTNTPVILNEARLTPQNVRANVSLTVSNVSAAIEEGTVTDIWQVELYPKSDPSTYRVAATLTPEQNNQGLDKSDTIRFDDLLFAFNTYNFVCPPSGMEELCVEVSTDMDISPVISIAFRPNGTDCVTVECRGCKSNKPCTVFEAPVEIMNSSMTGIVLCQSPQRIHYFNWSLSVQGVIFDNLVVTAHSDSSFVEFESMHRITFNISTNTAVDSTEIANEANLWQVRVYGSLYMNGTGERYSETQIPIPDTNATVTAGIPVEYTGLMWDMDLTNFTCPNTNQFYMCVELMPGNMPSVMFSVSPRPLITCVEIECTGVLISDLALTVNSGDPVLERQSNDVNLTVTATSSMAGSSINGDDLWQLTILVCERDQCADARRRRRATNPNALVEVTANLTTTNINTDLAAGDSITFANIFQTLDLTSLEECPANEMVYICVQLEKGNSPSPDYTLQGDLFTCQAVQCRGVHIQSSSTANEMGTLQEGNPSNAVELDFTFTADTLSSDISGTMLWGIQIYTSNSQHGGTSGTGVTLGNISSTGVPLSAGGTIEFRGVTSTVDLSPYITCQEAQYVCGRLIRGANSSQRFSVTGERTACYLYTCTGVQVRSTSVEITNNVSPIEGQAVNIVLNVSLSIDASSSNLSNVMDAWGIEVFGNPQMNGLGSGGTGRFIANTTSVGDVGAMPGMTSVLSPVSVSFDLSSYFCENIEYLCVKVQRGVNATPPFNLGGVTSSYEHLQACTDVNCIGVRIKSSMINAVTKGDPILQGNPSFEVEFDVVYISDESGAGVSGTNIFEVEAFLSRDSTGSVIIGEKYTADIPEGAQSTSLVAGEQLDIRGATASISTENLECQTGALYLCAELVRFANASYLLNGYNSTTMMVADSLLIACEMVECRDVRFDDMQLSTIDPPCIIERTANQLLTVNVTVEPNSMWSNASGTGVWMMNAMIMLAGQLERTESIMLSTENADRDVIAGIPTTFPNVELSLDLSDFYCPAEMVDLCVSISPTASSGVTISANSNTQACSNIPCKVTEIDDSDYEIFFPPNILEYSMNDLRFAVSLTAAPVSASIEGDELWKIVRVYMSGFAEGNDSVAEDTTVPLLSSQDEVGISAGETVRLLNIQASLNLQNVNCDSMPYLCVEVAKGDSPNPEFNVSFNNNSNIICKENVRCQGIVIEETEIQSSQELDAEEGNPSQRVNINVTVSHDEDLGTRTGGEMYPWMITVFYNDQMDCMGDDFGTKMVAEIDDHQMLVDGQHLVFENLDVTLNLSQLVCPERNIYFCTEFEKNASSAVDFTLNYEPPSARFAVQQVPCHGVEISGSEFTLTGGIRHEQEAPNHEITFGFTFNSSESSRSLSGSGLWSFLIYGSRNSDGSGPRVINHDFDSNLTSSSIQPSGTFEFDPSVQMLNLSFEDIKCVDMPYLCLEIRKGVSPSVNFSLWGIPDDSRLYDCFELDCRGVFIEEFNVTLTPGDEIVYENDQNQLTAVNLSLSSDIDKENATGMNLWEIYAYFSDEQDGTGEVIARTQVTPLPDNQDDQNFLAGQQINFGPLTFEITLSDTCENVMYLCFELAVNDAAITASAPVLLGSPVSCVPVDCRGVVVANTNLQVNPIDFTETEGPINFEATATIRPHSDSADISGSSLWSLAFFLSDSPAGNTSFARAPLLTANEPLSVGSDVIFSGVRPVFNASEVLCYEAMYLCMELRKNSAASPDFGLSGLPDDNSLIGCAAVSCIGVVVASTQLDFVVDPVLISGEPNLQLGPLTLASTFAVQTRSISNGNDLFSIGVVARSATGMDIVLEERQILGPSSTVVSSGMLDNALQSLIVDLTGIRCDQMTSICGVLQKGSNPVPDFTLQGQGGDMTRLENCIQLPCRGVQVDNMFVNFVSGVPLLEDTAAHEVNFTLTVESSPMGADVSGDDLWSLTAFLSRYENGSDPISRRSASIGDDANTALPAGGSIDIGASVTLNISDFVCDTEVYLCVILSKGSAVDPDYTLEGVGTFSDLQVCQPFTCNGVNLTNANLTFSQDNVLRHFDSMSAVTVDVSVDVLAGSATVSGRDLWHLEFFTSTDAAGNMSPSPRTMAANLTADQGSVSLIAGATSSITGVNVVLDLSSVSCNAQRYLCVEIWRGQRAFPFYTINSPASRSALRACNPITCVGVEFTDINLNVITPPIWIEGLANQTVTLEIHLQPDSTKAGVMGLDLFEVDVFASASNTGTDGRLASVTVPVSNTYASNLVVNRFQNTTLTNVQAQVDFTSYNCSDLMYVCVEVRRGPNAMPDYTLMGTPYVKCDLQPCAGVIVTSVAPSLELGSDQILEGDAAHTFTFSLDAVTGNGIMTLGTNAWQIEVFVSSDAEGTNPLESYILNDLTAPSVPNGQIEFSNLEATLNLSNFMCNEFQYFCARLSAPGASFTLRGSPMNSVLLGCRPQTLTCLALNENLIVQDFTDATLTVQWEPSIGDFDSYSLAINPRHGQNPEFSQIKTVTPYEHTFSGLTPGDNYTVTLQLTKGASQKGAAVVHQNAPTTLLPSCPALDILSSDITSMEITVTWPRPEGYTNVGSYTLMISPDTGVTFSARIANPFTAAVGTTRQTFSSLTPGQTYTIEVQANHIDGGDPSVPGCNSRTVVAKPATVVLQVTAYNTTSVSLAWGSDLSVTPDGYMLTIDILSTVPDAAPAPIDVPGTDTAYVVTSLLPGVEYEFTVQAYQNNQGTRAFGDEDIETQRTTPVPPENIAVQVTETTAIISYQAPQGYHDNFTMSLLDADDNVISGPDSSREFSMEYNGLTAGTVYTFTILTIAGNLDSETVRQTFTSRPNPPGVPLSTFVDETTITIAWDHNVGVRDNYEVTYSPNGTSYIPQSPHNVIENTFTLAGLDPYTTIQFEVRTVVNLVTSLPTMWRQRTFATRPDVVQNLMIVTTSASSVNVIFTTPERPNGLISGYLITYSGTRNTATSSGNQLFTDIHPNDVRIEVPISNLNPGFNYQFSVQALNEEGASDPVLGEVTLVAGDPVPSGNGIDTRGAAATSTSNTITIVISDNLFSDINGDVIALQVFVAEVHASNTDLTISDPPLRYQQVVNLPFRLPYVTSPLFAPTPFIGFRRKRQIANTQTTFTIGSELECVSEDSICNGPLEPLTSYRILIRAYTDGGFADSPWSEPITTRGLDSWFTIPIIVYGIIIFFILIFLILCCLSSGRHRRKKVKSSPGPRKARGFHSPQQESRFNDNHNNSSYRHPQQSKAPPAILSRPILSAHFAQHYNEMIANKQHKFTMEFDDLRNIGQDLSKSHGRSSENKNKNRFGNILPYNETRVQLNGPQDYINGNYITGFSKSQEYIATQGPMSNTVHDFWRMIWEKECPCIIMLVRCIEGGKEKCDKYWPVNADPTVFGKVIVTKLAEHNHDNWAVRDFRLKVGSEERLVRQYHFIAWPTHSTPRISRPIINFVRNVREEQESARLKGPIVVHCGAGIGRTGVFIALDILMQEMKADERTVDVFAVVAKMRRERCTMVQSLVQYIFLHRAIADYLQGQGHAVEASSIERSDGGSIQSDEIEEMSNTSL